MLTKEDREEIAERLNNYDCESLWGLYRELIGVEEPEDTTYKEDVEAFCKSLIGLCDTSNMIELPLDKDGIPFKRGDTVYESDGTKHIVDGYAFSRANAKIVSVVDLINNTRILFEADEITHKKPVTIASLAKELADIVASDYGTPMVVKHKISEIADQLERLGDSDD
jgi:hypothetical protein